MIPEHLKDPDPELHHYCERWYKLLSTAFIVTIVMLVITLTCVMVIAFELSKVAPADVRESVLKSEMKLDALLKHHKVETD